MKSESQFRTFQRDRSSTLAHIHRLLGNEGKNEKVYDLKVKVLKQRLQDLLAQPLMARGVSAKFITSGSRSIADDLIHGRSKLILCLQILSILTSRSAWIDAWRGGSCGSGPCRRTTTKDQRKANSKNKVNLQEHSHLTMEWQALVALYIGNSETHLLMSLSRQTYCLAQDISCGNVAGQKSGIWKLHRVSIHYVIRQQLRYFRRGVLHTEGLRPLPACSLELLVKADSTEPAKVPKRWSLKDYTPTHHPYRRA
jgi:hypothetical protein